MSVSTPSPIRDRLILAMTAQDACSSRTAPLRSLPVINSGTLGLGAWFPRLSCLDDGEVLTIL